MGSQMQKYSKLLTEYFDLGTYLGAITLPSGYANENYRLDTSKGSFLLRNCLQQTVDLLQYEIDLMELLASYQFPTAYPVCGKDGNHVLTLDEHNFMVYHFLHGTQPEPNQRTVTEIGKAVGLLSTVRPFHQFEHKKNTLHLDHINELITRFLIAKNPLPDIFKFIEGYAEKFNCLETEGLPKGIIHGDIFPNNTLFSQDDQLAGIIDFEEACVDHLLLDVGMTINGFCFVNNAFSEILVDHLLKSYHECRPLLDIEANLLVDFIQLAAFSMMCWHMRFNLVDQQNDRQEARVRELMDRIQNLNSITFNL